MFDTKRNRNIAISIFFMILVSLGAMFYLYAQIGRTKTPEFSGEEASLIAAAVEKLIVVPTDEIATVSSVVDVEKLRGQEFFENAMEGDKVVIYEKSRKAVLYRPSVNKIVEITKIINY